MTEFVSEIAIFHISLLMFVSLIYLSFWLYFFVVYEAINSIQTIGYYILFGVCGTNILVIGPGALCILRKGVSTNKPILFKAIICSFIILGLLSLFPTPLLSNLASGESTKKYLHDFFIEYGRAPYLMDYIQKAHQCCGYFDYADYYQKPVESKDTFSEPVPKSCCSELVEDCEKSSVIYKQGCFVHAGSNRPKGWVQPFQGTGFLGVLLIPLALPLFQLLPTCFLHDAIQILAQKRAKLSQDAELEVRIEETPAKSHLSRKTKRAKPVENHHLVSQSASSTSTSTIVVNNRKGHGEASVSVVSVLLEEMDLASSKLLESEDTVSSFNQQTSDRVDSEERGSRKSAKTAARSGAPPVLLTIKENNKEKDTEPSNKVPELLLHVPNKTGSDSHRQQDIKNEHHVRDPSDVLNNYMEPEVGHNDHHSHNHQHGQEPHDSQHPHHHHDNHDHPHGHTHPPHHHNELANHHEHLHDHHAHLHNHPDHLHDHHAHLHNHPDHHHEHHDPLHEHHDHHHEHHDHPHDHHDHHNHPHDHHEHHDHPHDHHDHPHEHHDHHNHPHPGFHEENHHHHDSAPHHTHHHENDHHNSGNHHHPHDEGHHHHAGRHH